ncbi:PREDICTED: SPRY domain-containing SOCS box protein 3-like isoform X2 [Papilio xuthus]|uniref:SPRY domain-containing SOCS box protein 3-like isoform X2 n=1 Tax=Papilio xuthus TaxID=66420 RepID=A0AAJ7EBB9_PAPXU|nr:PREDICTED: SPRY domain-containing SOCS box protein 3-like isoform X2 [Papilio xuthus]
MLSRSAPYNDTDIKARPYCQCWVKKEPVLWKELSRCSCGEEADVFEWKWHQPDSRSQVVMSDDRKQVTFHPFYSSGTAAVRGETPMVHNNHYYWEVKMLSEPYGTDIMVGVGSGQVPESQFTFTSLLGQDSESYGLSYLGPVRHDAAEVRGSVGFCRGSIIGVRVDMWVGTLEFFINRQPQGVCIYNLRRHEALYPMICSTAAQSTMRLIYSASWRASLLVDAAKVLASSAAASHLRLPPGLWNTFKSHFWLTLPTEVVEDKEGEASTSKVVRRTSTALSEFFSSQYMNGFYVDNVERDFRIVVWQ